VLPSRVLKYVLTVSAEVFFASLSATVCVTSLSAQVWECLFYRPETGSYRSSGVARLEVMEGQTRLTCIPRKTLGNVNEHTKG